MALHVKQDTEGTRGTTIDVLELLGSDSAGHSDVDGLSRHHDRREAVLTIEGFGGYFTRGQLLSGQVPDTMIGRSMLKTYYAPRGGDLVVWVLPLYFWGKYGEKDGGSTHGTAYSYDSEVPVLISGPHVRPGRYGTRDQVDLAATLSHLLGIPKPAGCEGAVVPITGD